MTNKVEMMIEELENNGKVIISVKYEDGNVESIEMVDDFDGVVALEVVELVDYENNGYDVEGLAGMWLEVK